MRKGAVSTRTWILVITAAALILGALSYVTLTKKSAGRVAEVVQDGVIIRAIDLDRVAEEYSFTVEWPEGGSNTVTVRPGRICVSEADCPDRICVEQGWLTDQASPIVCLPHRLVIRLAGADGTVDAETR